MPSAAPTKLSVAPSVAAEAPSDDDRARSETFRALLEINKKINPAAPTDALLTAIAEEAARLLEVDNAGFRLVDGDELVVAGLAGTAHETMTRQRIGLHESLSGQVLTEGRAIIIDLDRASGVLLPEHLTAGRRLGFISFLGVPLRAGDRIIGVLSFRARRRFSPRDQEVAEAFAGQAALALEQARLYRDTQRQAERMAALAAVERLVAETLDADVVAQRIVDSVCDLVGARSAALYRLDAEAGRLAAQTVAQTTAFTFEWPRLMRADQGIAGYAVRERRAVWSSDTLADPRVLYPPEVIARIERSTDRGVLAVPLIVRDRVIGALAVGDHTGRRFTDEDVRLAAAFADQAAVALQNARVHEESERRRRTAEHLAALGRLLSQSLDPEEVAQRIVESVRALFGVMRCALYGAMPGVEDVVVLGFSNDPSLGPAFGRDLTFQRGIGAVGLAVSERRLVMTPDLLNDPGIPLTPELRARFEASPIRAVLGLPLVVGDVVIGVLATGDRAGRIFDDEELRILGAFGDQAAVALENARLYRRAREYGDRLVALEEVNRLVSSSIQMEAVLHNIATALAKFFDAPYVAVWVFDPTTRRARRVVAHGDPEFSRGLSDELGVGQSLVGWVLEHREPILWTDVEQDPRVLQPSRMIAYGMRYFTVYPIAIGDRLLGAFSMSRMTPPLLAPETRSLLGSLAAQAALALDHARLFAETRRQVEELSALNELSRAVTGQLDRAALIDAVAVQMGRVLDARQMVAVLVDPERNDLEVIFLITDGIRQSTHERYPLWGVGLQSVVLKTGDPVRTDDYVAECARQGVQPVPRAASMRFWLGVPMRAGDETLGVIALWNNDRAFTASDERLLTNFGQVAALALRSARLFEDRRRAHGELAAAQDQLVRTEKLRALGEMASGVAHDFNNLLAAILGRAQLLQRYVQDPKLAGWLQVIERSAIDGAQTVRRLQEFARVRRDEPFGPVDLNQVIRDAIEMTQSRWREDALRQGVAIDVSTSTAPNATVAGDAAELREAMTNLILNAVDAMPRGGTLSVSSATVGDRVELTVSDTGVGIPAAVRERIFDPFFTTKGPQGTGLGLSMTYGILSRHGARITVDSVEGEGSTFRITFARGEPAAPVAPVVGEEPVAAGSLRCLVVDDERAVAAVLGDVLEASGHHVVVLTDGAEAIARVKKEVFDVVFTDLAMPRVSGWDVAHAVQASAPGIPVFLVTGFGVELSAAERRAHGVAEVFSKPLRIEDIARAVAHVSRQTGSRAAPEATA